MNALEKFSVLPPLHVLLGSLVLAGLYYVLLYDSGSKLENMIGSIKGQQAQLEEESKNLDKNITEINFLKASQEKDAERLKLLMSYIPENLTMVELMRIVSNEAKAVGLNINKLSTGSTVSKPGEFYDEMDVKVDIAGSFTQILRFLSNLTRIEQILTLQDMTLRRSGGADAGAVLAMGAGVKGYKYRAQPAAGVGK